MELRREVKVEGRFEQHHDSHRYDLSEIDMGWDLDVPSEEPVPRPQRLQTEPSKRTDEFFPGAVLPKRPTTLGWAIPPPPPTHCLRVLELAQNKVEARALTQRDAKSWYTTAAFEIRRAELSGDHRLLHSALISLDFAERASNSLRSRFSGERQVHHVTIRSLRDIVHARLQDRPS